MSKKQIPVITADLAQVVEFLQSRGKIPEKPPANMLSHVKRMHRVTYSLILWKFRLKNLSEHGQVFIEEIASDAIQILPQAVMGYGKTPRLLIRGIAENTIRHLYFSDHPVEFRRMNREQKWFPSVEDLFDYPRNHDVLMELESKFDAVNRLKTLYGELSATVHGRRVQDLQLCKSLRMIEFVESVFEKQVAEIERCAASVNFLLAGFHSRQFNDLHREDRQIILGSMPSRARQVLKGLE